MLSSIFQSRSPAPRTVQASPSLSSSISGKALRLVYQDEKGNFAMDSEAVECLRKVKGPLAVASVCGRARQGKSFILNQLLGHSSGFVIGPTHRPCTKGLWMWSNPISRTAPDGSQYHLLLLDSEGIEAYDQTGQYSTQIFSLAVLLSSLFIFNQMGGIDEAALDNLALVTEMTKHIRIKSKTEATSASELGNYTPSFIWLLRDFYLDLVENGKAISPKDYLEGALLPMAGTSKAVAAKNEIRNSIRALFPDRECFALVRPLNDEKSLQRLDQVPMTLMRPEFRKGIEQLTDLVFEKAKPKRMGTAVLTGPILAALTQSYLDALNAGAVPSIATSWQGVEEQQCRLAMEAGQQAYNLKFRLLDAMADEGALRDAHRTSLSAAMDSFNQEAIGTGNVRKGYFDKLVDGLEKAFEAHKKKVLVDADLLCVQMLTSMEASLSSMAANYRNVSWQDIAKKLDQLLRDFESTASGPSKWNRAAKFLHKCITGALASFVSNTLQLAADRLSEVQSQVNVLNSSLAEARQQSAANRSDADSWRKKAETSASEGTALQSRTLELQHQLAVLQQQVQVGQKEVEAKEAKVREAEEKMKSVSAAAQSRSAEMQNGLQKVQEELGAWRRQAEEWKVRHEGALKEFQAREARMLKEQEASRKLLVDSHESELRKMMAEMQQLRGLQISKSEQVVKLSSRVKECEDELQSLRIAVAGARGEVQELQVKATMAENKAKNAELELSSARSSQSESQGELQAALQRCLEAENARSALDLQLRRQAELAEQAKMRAEVAERNFSELQSLLADKTWQLEQLRSRAKGSAEELEARAAIAEKKVVELSESLAEKESAMAGIRCSLLEKEQSMAVILAGVADEEIITDLKMKVNDVEILKSELDTCQARIRLLGAELEAEKKRAAEESLQRADKRQKTEAGRSSKRSRADVEEEAFQEVGDQFDDVAIKPETGVESDLSQGGVDPARLTKLELKKRITEAGFGHLVLNLRNPTKGQLVDIYRQQCPGK